MLSFHLFANQIPLPRFTVHTRAAVSPFARPPISVSPLFATHTSRSQTTENSSALSPLLATHTDFVAVTPVFATHTKTTGVYTNNSHSGTGEGWSCRPNPKVCFESGAHSAERNNLLDDQAQKEKLQKTTTGRSIDGGWHTARVRGGRTRRACRKYCGDDS